MLSGELCRIRQQISCRQAQPRSCSDIYNKSYFFPVFSSVMYSSALRIRLILPSNYIKTLSGLNQAADRKAVNRHITSSTSFVLPSVSRLLHTNTPVRMDSIITPEKALGTSHIPKSELAVELTAPNGRKYTQPIGLFINNEWVKSSNGQKLTSVNPTYE